MGELEKYVLSAVMIIVVLWLYVYYILEVDLTNAFYVAVLVTVVAVIGHELVHEVVAKYVCNFTNVRFSIPRFALEITIFSIVVLAVLIVLKQTTGIWSYLVPIIASPGAVVVDRIRTSDCGDDVAIAAPTYNLVVGIAALAALLFMGYQPPFVVNDTSNTTVFLLANLSLFSLSLAFLNALPIKIGDVALDGWYALTIDRDDAVVRTLTVTDIVASAAIIYMGMFAIVW